MIKQLETLYSPYFNGNLRLCLFDKKETAEDDRALSMRIFIFIRCSAACDLKKEVFCVLVDPIGFLLVLYIIDIFL